MRGDYYGYLGPGPPWNDALVHHYVFTLYGLDVPHLEVRSKLTGTNVRAALAEVESGNVDAGFVYKTDANISKKVKTAFSVPIEKGPAIRYPVAIIKEGKNNGAAELGLVGIRRRGVPLAQRLGQMIARIEKTPVPVGTLDITLYRDDLSTLGPKPVVQKTEIGLPITGKNVILVDDVLYTGRTIRAAMDALFREGRPKQVQLCVLIDRGHRELPIEAGFIGRKVQTSDREIIEVKLREVDDMEKVLLVERQD